MGKKSRKKMLGEHYREERYFKALWDNYLREEYIAAARYHFNKTMRVE